MNQRYQKSIIIDVVFKKLQTVHYYYNLSHKPPTYDPMEENRRTDKDIKTS